MDNFDYIDPEIIIEKLKKLIETIRKIKEGSAKNEEEFSHSYSD